MLSHPWPLFDLRLRTPRLELRLPTDDDLLALARVARQGIHDPARPVFLVPWDELPSPAFERQFLLHWWASRGRWRPDDWSIGFAVVADGRPIGIQSLLAHRFAVRRVVETASWLGRDYQARGYGTEMRAAVLWLAFEGLGALAAESGAFEGNVASERVSARLGYEPNGTVVHAVGDRPLTERRLRVTREAWRSQVVAVTLEGLEPCLPLFGAVPLGPADLVVVP